MPSTESENDLNQTFENKEPIVTLSMDKERDPLKETQMAQCTVSSGEYVNEER